MSNSRNTETIRRRLVMTKEEFSTALGMTAKAYAQHLTVDSVSDTVALAAEALMRRQAAASDVTFVVRVVKGIPQFTPLDELDTLSFRGARYLLLPIDDDKVVQVQRQPKMSPPSGGSSARKPRRKDTNRPASDEFVQAKRLIEDALLEADGETVAAERLKEIIRPLWPEDKKDIPVGPVLEQLRRAGTAIKIADGEWRANV